MAIIDQTEAKRRADQRKADMPKRGGLNVLPMLLSGTAMAVGVIPGIGVAAGPLSHVATRMKNSVDAKRELKERTNYYRNQIAGILGISPHKVTTDDFKRATQASPAFRRMYEEVKRVQARENNIDLAASAGVSAAGALGLGWAGEGAKKVFEASKVAKGAATMGTMTIGAIGGGAIGGILSKNSYTAEELVEAVERSLIDADERGQSRVDVVKPQTLFLIRLAQNPALLEQTNKAAKSTLGKPVHQLSESALHELLSDPKHGQLRKLASVAKQEADEIVANPDVQAIREVGAAATNVVGDDHGTARQARGSHVAREIERRGANNNLLQTANDIAPMSHAERVATQNVTRAADQGLSA